MPSMSRPLHPERVDERYDRRASRQTPRHRRVLQIALSSDREKDVVALNE